MAGPLHDLLPPGDSPGSDELLGRFLDYVDGKGLTLYPAQEEAILELFEGRNVILNTPTGSGKSLVASALHFASLAHGRRSVYTCPIKALVNEKWMALCRELGPDNVGLSTGDATVNREAPVLCCTAEVLANIALREGEDAWVDDVVMDEFHWYADRDRGVAWQVPLLTLPRARFLLMSATLGDMAFFAEDAHPAHRPAHRGGEVRRAAGAARVRVLRDPARADAREARLGGQGARLRRPLHAEGRRGQRAGLHEPQPVHPRGEERGRGRDRRFPLHQPLRPRRAQVAQAGDRRSPRGAPAEVPGARRAARASGPAQGHLRHRHPRRRHQRPDPHRPLLAAVQVRRAEDGGALRARLPPDRRASREEGLRRHRLRRGPGPGARDREPPARGEGEGREEGRQAEAARAQLRELGPPDAQAADGRPPGAAHVALPGLPRDAAQRPLPPRRRLPGDAAAHPGQPRAGPGEEGALQAGLAALPGARRARHRRVRPDPREARVDLGRWRSNRLPAGGPLQSPGRPR